MKTALFYILGLLFSINTLAQNNLVFIEANEAYNKGEYEKAAALYEKILNTGNHSANLYFNLANSYYKLQKIGPSIYNYEKALQLSPNNKDILVNYGYAKQTRLDDIKPLPKGFLKRLYESLVKFDVDFWAWLSVLSVFVFVAGFILFYKSYDPSFRKIYFGLWSLGLIVALVSVLFSFATENYKKKVRFAVIFASEVRIQSEPNLRSEQLFQLHEGTKIKVLETVDDWKKMELADGKIGWISEKFIKEL